MTVTLPTFAKANARMVRDALANRAGEMSHEEQAALVQLCDLIAGLFQGFFRSVNDNLAKGVGSRALLAGLNEGIEAGEEAIEQCLALQQAIDAGTDVAESLSETLKRTIREVERVHKELMSLAAWVGSPPPPADLDRLKEASKGPFTPLKS